MECPIWKRLKRFLNKDITMNISKKNTFLIVTCSSLVSSIVVAQNISEKDIHPEWLKKYSDKEIYDMFDNPPMFYAPHTFWFWDLSLIHI